MPYVLKAAHWLSITPHLRDAAKFIVTVGTEALSAGDVAGDHSLSTRAAPR
jgi:hypothetical protein